MTTTNTTAKPTTPTKVVSKPANKASTTTTELVEKLEEVMQTTPAAKTPHIADVVKAFPRRRVWPD
ncbi:hypothetical protein [Thiosulfativibrio zosterae]|uniref:Uncharacterized protein n=1 Tax=Thiosulfativibrio zosterae TaxID=2675053 RepID=A0A6F8PPS8_9GAMM|nr:hypothetical protein [Thiosulfativibrio zosterae]BBP44119.1 hypothetical protein THMIRHAT_18650 [Thiosulfativibrio zosterae]